MFFADDRVKALSLAVVTGLGAKQLTSGMRCPGLDEGRPGQTPWEHGFFKSRLWHLCREAPCTMETKRNSIIEGVCDLSSANPSISSSLPGRENWQYLLCLSTGENTKCAAYGNIVVREGAEIVCLPVHLNISFVIKDKNKSRRNCFFKKTQPHFKCSYNFLFMDS